MAARWTSLIKKSARTQGRRGRFDCVPDRGLHGSGRTLLRQNQMGLDESSSGSGRVKRDTPRRSPELPTRRAPPVASFQPKKMPLTSRNARRRSRAGCRSYSSAMVSCYDARTRAPRLRLRKLIGSIQRAIETAAEGRWCHAHYGFAKNGSLASRHKHDEHSREFCGRKRMGTLRQRSMRPRFAVQRLLGCVNENLFATRY